MIQNQTVRKNLHYLFSVIYIFARYFYKALKVIFRPIVHLHPRIYNFAIALREAVRELIRPPEIHPHVIPENLPETAFEPIPEVVPETPCEIPEPVSETEDTQPEIVQESVTEPEPRLPAWLIEEWRAIHEIEPRLFPEKHLIENVPFYHVPTSRIVEPYLELCRLYGDNVSHVFLVPWLLKGGSDLEAINYIQSLTIQGLADNIVVISTTDIDSPWKERLPEKTRFIEFGKMYAYLSGEEQEKLLIRLLLQMAPQVIHNVNSDLCYRVFVKYGGALKSISKLYVSLFCIDMTEEGRYAGYPVMYVPKCFDYLEAIFTDNLAHLKKLEEICAFDARKMFVHYHPAPAISKQYPLQPGKKEITETGGLNKEYFDILWAGRLDRQKRPDILIEIAKKCKNLSFRFHVYGSPVLDTDVYTNIFSELENMTYHGSFDGLSSLPAEQYDLFLYTSQWDGLPNVLLEAISLGLPVVASDVGGISELICHGETGFLIDPYDNINAYLNCLEKIYDNPSKLEAVVNNAHELLILRHSWDAFNENVRNIPYYCRGEGETGDCRFTLILQQT